MPSVTSSPGARRLLATSIVARMPAEMLSVGLLVHTRHLTGSFAQAGIVTSVYAIALGVGGPQLGKLVDRHGQTAVLLLSASFGAALLLTIAMLPPHISLAVLSALAAGAGLATPPVGACLRAVLPALLDDPDTVRQLFALEAALVELTYVAGPPLVLCIGGLWSSAGAIGVSGLILLAATAAFAAQPASRRGPATRVGALYRRGSIGTPAMRTLVIILTAVGLLLGAGEVAVIAAAQAVHRSTADAPLFAVWGAGSFMGGLVITRLGGGARTAAGLVFLLGALAVGHLALIPVSGSIVGLGLVLFFAGAAIAPTEASVYAMVDRAAPSETMTEAFAWLATAMAVGSAIGCGDGRNRRRLGRAYGCLRSRRRRGRPRRAHRHCAVGDHPATAGRARP